jgi:hypothetical protein
VLQPAFTAACDCKKMNDAREVELDEPSSYHRIPSGY